MTVIRPRPPTDPLLLEVAAGAASPWWAGSLAEPLERARAEILAAPAGLDVARSMLAEYDTRRPESRLFAVLQAAGRIRTTVDRVVVVAGGGLGPGMRLLSAACCHPFHDQLARGDRGGRPRLSWLDGGASPDELRGLLDVVAPPGRPPGRDLLDRWTVLAADVPPDDSANLAVVRLLLAELAAAADGSSAARLVAIAPPGSELERLAKATSPTEWFAATAPLDGPLGLFTAAGLLPAAIAGIDVVQLLKGANAMFVRFAEAPLTVNPVVADAAVSLAAASAGRPGRRFVIDDRSLAELAAWHRWLRPTRLADAAAVTRIEGGVPRRDWPAAQPAPAAGDAAGSGFGDAPAGVRREPVNAAEPAAIAIRLPRIDEHALGQMLQLLALSAAVEERLQTGGSARATPV